MPQFSETVCLLCGDSFPDSLDSWTLNTSGVGPNFGGELVKGQTPYIWVYPPKISVAVLSRAVQLRLLVLVDGWVSISPTQHYSLLARATPQVPRVECYMFFVIITVVGFCWLSRFPSTALSPFFGGGFPH